MAARSWRVGFRPACIWYLIQYVFKRPRINRLLKITTCTIRDRAFRAEQLRNAVMSTRGLCELADLASTACWSPKGGVLKPDAAHSLCSSTPDEGKTCIDANVPVLALLTQPESRWRSTDPSSPVVEIGISRNVNLDQRRTAQNACLTCQLAIHKIPWQLKASLR